MEDQMSSDQQGQNYQVFLNFRGKDTRKTFTDHLYHRLVDVGVSVFRDNEGLHVGEEIHANLLRAIRSSKISIPIISPDYASSKWCLRELVQILECRETSDQIVIPILYHVHPSDLKHQSGSFGKAFSTLTKNNSDQDVRDWKMALKEVTSLKVLELNDDRYEAELVKEVVEKVLTDLSKITMVVPEYLIGVKEQAEEITEKLDLNSSNGVQLVLIHGMSGIGKTTLAKFLGNKLCNRFKHYCFLEITGEIAMLQLVNLLISNILGQKLPRDICHVDEGIGIIKSRVGQRKVLLVLDDVDHLDQPNALIEKFDHFGSGSILIITSKNIDVLNGRHVELAHQVKELNFDRSLRLFCKHALHREGSHFGEFETVGRDIVSTTGGLPLAIKVVGSFLSGKGIDIWKETLKRLERMPDHEVFLKLKMSYEDLSDEVKKIFLDIACLYSSVGRFASFMYMWDGCGYYPRYGIEVLKSKSLIKEVNEVLVIMHEQLRLFGKEIIRQESRDLLGRRRILWDEEEAWEVIKGHQGTEQIEVLNLTSNKRCEGNRLSSKQFKRFKKLRFLHMNDVNLVGNFKNCFLNLRWLQWYECPSNFMATNFCPKHLVVLNLSQSNITEQWEGWSELKCAEKLKELALRECDHLIATPDLSTFRELEILDLSYCKRLRVIHPSISRLTETLRSLRVEGCEKLEELPPEVGRMKELRWLTLCSSSIREIPLVEGFMTKVKSLSPRHCKKLTRLPDSIGSLTKLEELDLCGCVSLTTIPESIGKLESLSNLDLSNTSIKQLPESIGNLHNLEDLRISGTPIERLPAAIGMLKKLQSIEAMELHGLTGVPMEIGELTHLEDLSLNGASISGLPNLDELTCLRGLYLDGALISGLPTLPDGLTDLSFSGCSMESLPNLSYLSNLHSLYLSDMDVIPELPSRLRSISFHGCRTLSTLPSFSNMECLEVLSIEDCAGLMEIGVLEEVQSLEVLKIINCPKISKLSGLGNLLRSLSIKSCDALESLTDPSTFKNLEVLHVVECNNIVEIQGLDTIKWLPKFYIHDCSSLERIGDITHFTMLDELGFGNCPKLRDIDYPCIDKFTSLKYLCLFGGSTALKLPDLPKFKNLNLLGMNNFEELREIPMLKELKSLEYLSISGCKSLENLPDFSEFTNLRGLDAQGCAKLTEFRGLENLDSFASLYIFGCRSLKQLPKLRRWSRIHKEKSKPWWCK